MTMREFYQNVLNTCGTTVSPWGEDEEQIVDICHKQIDALDARNEKRKSSDSKEKKEVINRRDIVLSLLSAEPTTAEVIAEQSGLSVGQVRSALTSLVKADLATKTEVKSGKSRKMNYSLKG